MRHFMKELASDNQPLPQRQHGQRCIPLLSNAQGAGLLPHRRRDGSTHRQRDAPREYCAPSLPTAASYDAPPLFSSFRGRLTLKSETVALYAILELPYAKLSPCTQFWSDQMQDCRLVRNFGGANATMPSCAGFWSDRMQNWSGPTQNCTLAALLGSSPAA